MFEPEFPPDLRGIHLQVAGLLLDNRGGWITSKQIAAKVGVPAANVRHIIQELIDDYRLELIGDRLCGFRFADSRSEFEEHQAANVKQALTSLERAKARLGERRFRGLLIRLGIQKTLGLEQEITALPGPLENTNA
jgi:hypothetical protein